MKRLIARAAVGLLFAALASPALAANFTPVGSPGNPTVIFATGPVTLTQGSNPPINCMTTWKFHVNAMGKGKVINATFSGPGACATLSALNLNWIGKPASATSFGFTGPEVMGPAGACGGFQFLQLSGGGVISFSNSFGPPQNCNLMSSGLTTTPTLGIVYP